MITDIIKRFLLTLNLFEGMFYEFRWGFQVKIEQETPV